jgi:hypothetical protein
MTPDGTVFIKMMCEGEMIGGCYFPLALSPEFISTIEIAM